MKKYLSTLLLTLLLSGVMSAQERAKYVPYVPDPVIKEMIERNKDLKKEASEETTKIRERQKKEAEKKRKERKKLIPTTENIKKPGTPESFNAPFHFAPVAQYLTGTCWDFSATSFFESEIYRLGKKKIKLSEIYTAYFEYIEKARRFIRERGESEFGQGSESNAVIRIWKKYGVVPEEVYKGVAAEDGRHDHSMMFAEMNDFLHFLKEKDYWDEDFAVNTIRLILDKYLTPPPEKFTWQGKEYTPKSFLKSLPLNLDDYVGVMSTSSIPFYTQGEFKVPDNWWHSSDYYNLPLNEFYDVIKTAVRMGQTLTIGGDVSEPGYYGEEDICFVPTFDIPVEYINQDSREMRIYNRTTEDDHGIHLLAMKNVDGFDWFLIKDSARSARKGKYEGYLFYRGDYVKLKMLTVMVHKSAMKKYLPKFNQ
jgi:bleomycin hydrolase